MGRSGDWAKNLLYAACAEWRTALQNSTPSQLITMDKQYLDRILLRRSLISRHPETVHRCLPEGRAAVGELYTYLLVDYLPVRYPTMFKLSGAKSFHNLVTGSTYPTVPMEDSLAALRAIGETVEEDMFLLQETPDGHLAVAFICCFPSGFDPSQKFGNLLKDIHTPVPSYEKIGRSMERIFSRLEVGKTVKRQNVSAPLTTGVHQLTRDSGRSRRTMSYSTAREITSLRKTRTPALIMMWISPR